MVFKREPKTSNAKKARNAVAAQAKADKKASFQAAAKAHKATTNLPNRQSRFNVPGNDSLKKPAHTYTGKDVRKAVFDSHMAAQKAKAAGRPSPHKSFKNFPNRDRKTNIGKTNGGKANGGKANSGKTNSGKANGGKNNSGKANGGKTNRKANGGKTNSRKANVGKTNGGRAKPLPHMTVDKKIPHGPGKAPGREIDLPNRHNPARGPARVITQQTKAGHHTFKGVVTHDQSRIKADKGYNDHFQIKAVKPAKLKTFDIPH